VFWRSAANKIKKEVLDGCCDMGHVVCAEEVYSRECNAKVEGRDNKVYAKGIPAIGFDEVF